jgi:7-cyano-7-deazaguanine reductase
MDDLKHLKAGESPYKDRVDPGLLDSFANPRPRRPYEIRFSTREVTSLCPVTGQPDFYAVAISYVPGERCIESKSLKLYLFSFRNAGLFAEEMANRILEDLVAACEPDWMRVVCRMSPRGGIGLTVCAEHGQRPAGSPS